MLLFTLKVLLFIFAAFLFLPLGLLIGPDYFIGVRRGLCNMLGKALEDEVITQEEYDEAMREIW